MSISDYEDIIGESVFRFHLGVVDLDDHLEQFSGIAECLRDSEHLVDRAGEQEEKRRSGV